MRSRWMPISAAGVMFGVVSAMTSSVAAAGGPQMDTSPVNFGQVAVGPNGIRHDWIYLKNTSDTAQSVSVSHSGSNAGTTGVPQCYHYDTDSYTSTVDPGDSCHIEVTFDPTKVGAQSGQFIVYAISGSSVKSFVTPWTGTGVAIPAPNGDLTYERATASAWLDTRDGGMASVAAYFRDATPQRFVDADQDHSDELYGCEVIDPSGKAGRLNTPIHSDGGAGGSGGGNGAFVLRNKGVIKVGWGYWTRLQSIPEIPVGLWQFRLLEYGKQTGQYMPYPIVGSSRLVSVWVTKSKGKYVTQPTFTVGRPTVTGSRRVGQALTAHAATSGPATTPSLQWLRNGVAIPGATGATYRLAAADQGKRIRVRATYRKSGFHTIVRDSSPTAPVAAP